MGVIRLLLALSVFITHTKPFFGLPFVGGRIAVEAFFVISGFYMAFILNEKYTKPGSWRLFLQNRFLRLYPIYLFCVLFTLFVVIKIHTDPYLGWSSLLKLRFSTLLALIVPQITLIGQDIMLFFSVNSHTGFVTFQHLNDPDVIAGSSFLFVPTAWSLGIEMLFYVFAPFLTRRSNIELLFWMALSLIVRFVLSGVFGLGSGPWVNCFFLSELVFFLSGILAYRFFVVLRHRQVNLFFGKIFWAYLIAATLALNFVPIVEWGRLLIYIVLLIGTMPFIFLATRTTKLDRWIGELAYPFYLVHLLVLHINGQLAWHLSSINLAILSLFVSVLLVVLIEQPVNSWRQRRAGFTFTVFLPKIRLAAAAVLTIVACIGIARAPHVPLNDYEKMETEIYFWAKNNEEPDTVVMHFNSLPLTPRQILKLMIRSPDVPQNYRDIREPFVQQFGSFLEENYYKNSKK